MANVPTVIGRYQVIRSIGHGGMGALYLAWDEKLERQIAIKVLREDDEQLRERFAREAKSAARLRHPNIVTIFELGEYEGQPYIAMEYIQGRTLGELIKAREPLPLARKLELIAFLCDGLGFAHKAGVVHRDIKPANIMIDDEGALKILDFGIARIAESASMTQAGMMLGTLNYMSPEQITGLPVDRRTDIFAVGVVCYELLAYRQAFPGTISTGVLAKMLHGEPEPLATVCPGLDDDVIRIVVKALEKDAANRYQDLSVMRKEAIAVRARLDASAPSVTVADTAGPARPAPMTPAPTPRRPVTDRQELEKRRASQVQYYLDLADRAIAEERYDSAIAACEQTLLLDADNSRATDLSNRARTALEARQAKELLGEAERALQKGALTTAADLVNQAGTLQSSTQQVELRRAIDRALQEREQARQRTEAVRDAVGRAHAAFDSRSYTDAIRFADEALQLDPAHADAASLKTLAAEARARVAREAAERRARDVVHEARQIFARGDHAVAIALLEKFEPPHEIVLHAQSELQVEADRLAEVRRVEAAARAVKQRIAGGLALAREELRDQRFASALERLRTLQRTEGVSPEISALVQEVSDAERAHREAEERAARERKTAIAAALEQGRDAESNDDAMDALTRVLALDPDHEEAKTLLVARHQIREQELIEKTVVLQRQPAPPIPSVVQPDQGSDELAAELTREVPVHASVPVPVPAPVPIPAKRAEPRPKPAISDHPEPKPAPARGGVGLIGLAAAAVIVLAVIGYFVFRSGGEAPVASPENKPATIPVTPHPPPQPPPAPPVDQAFSKAMQAARTSLTAGRFSAAVQQFDALEKMNGAEFASQGLAVQRKQAAERWADEIAESAMALVKLGKLNDARRKFDEAAGIARTAAVINGIKLIDDRRTEFSQLWQTAESASGRQAFQDAVTNYQKAQVADPDQFRAQGGPSKLTQAQGKLTAAEKTAADEIERKRVDGLRTTAIAAVNLGHEFARQRKYDEADAKYQEALVADTTNKDATDALARSRKYKDLKSKGLSEFQGNGLDAAAKYLAEARDTDPDRFAADGLDKTLSDIAARRAKPVNTAAPAPDPLDAIRAAIDKLARALSTDTNPRKDPNLVKQAYPKWSGGDPFRAIRTQTWAFTALKVTRVTDTEAVVTAQRHSDAIDTLGKQTVDDNVVTLTLEKANGIWVIKSMVFR